MVNPFHTVSKCPYCKSYNFFAVLGDPNYRCVDCGKTFTVEDAQRITGVKEIPTHLFKDSMRIKW